MDIDIASGRQVETIKKSFIVLIAIFAIVLLIVFVVA